MIGIVPVMMSTPGGAKTQLFKLHLFPSPKQKLPENFRNLHLFAQTHGAARSPAWLQLPPAPPNETIRVSPWKAWSSMRGNFLPHPEAAIFTRRHRGK
jgi:hypothetical protein